MTMVLRCSFQFPLRERLFSLKYEFTRLFSVLKNFAESTLENFIRVALTNFIFNWGSKLGKVKNTHLMLNTARAFLKIYERYPTFVVENLPWI